MAKTFNRIIIIGRLGKDPELKSNGKTEYASFCLSNTILKDGEEVVQWHDIIAVGKQAKVCHEHMHKGDLCCIEGRLDRKTYEKDGDTKYCTAVIAERVTFLSSKPRTEEPNPADDAGTSC